jgi:hypothetical protein
MAAATACKVAAVVCTAALTAGVGVQEAKRLAAPEHHPLANAAAAKAAAPAAAAAAATLAPLKVTADVIRHRTDATAAPPAAGRRDGAASAPAQDPTASVPAPVPAGGAESDAAVTEVTGGAVAPSDPDPVVPAAGDDAAPAPADGTDGGAQAAPAEEAAAGETPPAEPGDGEAPAGSGSAGGPPSQH